MNPKYSEGESIILNSKQYPEFNGDYTVVGISRNGEVYKGKIVEAAKNAWYYDLGFNTPYHKDFNLWNERCLYKKHEPSQMSFESLIQSINSPVKQES